MLRLEDFMEIRPLHHDGLSLDRKTVRKLLRQPPRPCQRKARTHKVDACQAYLRERWEQGVRNAARVEIGQISGHPLAELLVIEGMLTSG